MSDAGGEGQPNPNMVQMDRGAYQQLQQGWDLLSKLWDHPEHGAAVKRAAKAIDPKLRVPEIDVAEPLLAPMREEIEGFKKTAAELREENAKIRAEREEEKALDKLRGSLGDAQKRYRLTDDGMAEVRKLMAERQIADPFAAAALVVSEIEPAKPMTSSNTFGPQSLNAFEMDGSSSEKDIALLHNSPEKWMDKVVPEILAEFDAEAA